MNTALSLSSSLVLETLDDYISAVNRIPRMSSEEERELASSFRENENLEAARRLVLSNLRFVVHIARGYIGYGLPFSDLIQEGNIGLMKAVKRYDPEVGVRLVSFAVHWIRAEIHEFIIQNWRIVKVATTKAQRKLFFNLRKSKKNLGWLTQDEAKVVAEDLGVPLSDVYEMESRLGGHDVSFDRSQEDEDNDSTIQAPISYLRQEHADPAEVLENIDWEEHSQQRLLQAIDALDDRSRDILTKRWLKDEKSTLQELAESYKVSAERVRQLENSALKKLRKALAL